MVMVAVPLQIIERFGVRENNPLQGIVFPGASSDVQVGLVREKQCKMCRVSSNRNFEFFLLSNNKWDLRLINLPVFYQRKE